ncbi:hypothetical protein ElyMa_002944700 [Elysia marginata]|uniref:SMB domain-containing protein n=1 Tax=Elysia marginata TaxID=1093978 RepID=A0AAV4I5T9_9GAST|nr:hypothetical protein ElyMa_002944700 [Elysia marginata]
MGAHRWGWVRLPFLIPVFLFTGALVGTVSSSETGLSTLTLPSKDSIVTAAGEAADDEGDVGMITEFTETEGKAEPETDASQQLVNLSLMPDLSTNSKTQTSTLGFNVTTLESRPNESVDVLEESNATEFRNQESTENASFTEYQQNVLLTFGKQVLNPADVLEKSKETSKIVLTENQGKGLNNQQTSETLNFMENEQSFISANKSRFLKPTGISKESNVTSRPFYREVEEKNHGAQLTNKSPNSTEDQQSVVHVPTRFGLIAIPASKSRPTAHFDRQNTLSTVAQRPSSKWEKFNKDRGLLFTCRGRCGLEISFPCGCSPSCVVYKTCCNDMEQDCPHIIQEGLDRFGYLMNSEFICSENLVFQVASCPKISKTGGENLESHMLPTIDPNRELSLLKENHSEYGSSLFNQGGQCVDQSSESPGLHLSDAQTSNLKVNTIDRFNEALLCSAPITEKTSGFTFANRSILECHKLNSSALSSWSLRLNYSYDTPTSLADVAHLLKAHNSYTPTFDEMILIPHLCIPNVIRTCEHSNGTQTTDEYLAEKCRTSTALVSSQFDGFSYYANSYCAFCNHGLHDKIRLHEINEVLTKRLDLHILMTITSGGEYKLKLAKGMIRASVSWQSARCFISTSKAALETGVSSLRTNLGNSETWCQAHCEGNEYILGADGKCKSLHSFLTAVADDGLSPLCASAALRLADFISCGLKSLTTNVIFSKADVYTPTVSVHFDTTTKKNLYVIAVYVGLTVPTATMSFDNKMALYFDSLNSLAVLAKSFKKYRLSHSLCGGTERGQGRIQLSPEILSSISVQFATRLYMPRNKTKFLETKSNQENATTICLTEIYSHLKVHPSKRRFTTFACIDANVFQHDQDRLDALGDSKCSQHLSKTSTARSNSASASTRLTYKLLVLALLARTGVSVLFINQLKMLSTS